MAAGIWITSATLLAERLGSKIGGLLTNLPSNILVSFVFISLTRDRYFAAEATRAVPIGMTVDTIFLFIFIVSLRFGVAAATALSLAVWAGLAFLAGHLMLTGWIDNIAIYVIIAIALFLICENVLKIPSAARTTRKYTAFQLLIRAVFAGGVVGGTVLISAFASAYWVGLFSTFPAVLLSTMIILSINQSPAFARATGKILLFSSSNIIIFGLGVFLTYPAIGLIGGTALSFFMAFLWVWIFQPFLKRLI